MKFWLLLMRSHLSLSHTHCSPWANAIAAISNVGLKLKFIASISQFNKVLDYQSQKPHGSIQALILNGGTDRQQLHSK